VPVIIGVLELLLLRHKWKKSLCYLIDLVCNVSEVRSRHDNRLNIHLARQVTAVYVPEGKRMWPYYHYQAPIKGDTPNGGFVSSASTIERYV
jgi:hypothetical protein